LVVFYTYTRQTQLVAEAMAEVLTDQGCEVKQAAIELTDGRYADRFDRFPLPFRKLVGMLPAQARHAIGEIRVPDEVSEGAYDLVCIGSPTWWLTACLPMRSFLKSPQAGPLLSGNRFTVFVVCRRYWRGSTRTVRKLGTGLGGSYIDGIHFKFAGGQVRSLVALISYLRTGRMRDRLWGVKIPPTNLAPEQILAARSFAQGLGDELASSSAAPSSGGGDGLRAVADNDRGHGV
jgi:hypothetical protein